MGPVTLRSANRRRALITVLVGLLCVAGGMLALAARSLASPPPAPAVSPRAVIGALRTSAERLAAPRTLLGLYVNRTGTGGVVSALALAVLGRGGHATLWMLGTATGVPGSSVPTLTWTVLDPLSGTAAGEERLPAPRALVRAIRADNPTLPLPHAAVRIYPFRAYRLVVYEADRGYVVGLWRPSGFTAELTPPVTPASGGGTARRQP